MSEQYFSRKEKIVDGKKLKPLNRMEAMAVNNNSYNSYEVFDMEDVFDAAQEGFAALITACLTAGDGKHRRVEVDIPDFEFSGCDPVDVMKAIADRRPYLCKIGGFVQCPCTFENLSDTTFLMQFVSAEYIEAGVGVFSIGYQVVYRTTSKDLGLVLHAAEVTEVSL